MIKVGIYGGSGYTGQELMRLLLGHPEAKVVVATSRRFAGAPVSEIYPALSGRTDLVYRNDPPEVMAGLVDFVFLALPHGVSMEIAPVFVQAGRKVVDLSADFRIRETASYEAWYGRHTAADTGLVGCEQAQQALDTIDKAKSFKDDIEKKAKEVTEKARDLISGSSGGASADKAKGSREQDRKESAKEKDD